MNVTIARATIMAPIFTIGTGGADGVVTTHLHRATRGCEMTGITIATHQPFIRR